MCQFVLRGDLAEILTRKTDRGAHLQQPVIDTGVSGVLGVLQVLEGQVGGDDQRPAAAVAAVDHIVDLFQTVLRPALHAEVVQDKQREAAKAGDVFVAVFEIGGKVIEDKGIVRHAHGNFFLHEGIEHTS